MRPDGTDAHLLAGDVPADPHHPDWSPDGTRLAFVVDDADTRDIWIADADGSNATRVFDCAAPCADADGVAWSPDGRSIAFRTFDFVGGTYPGSKLQILDVATRVVATVTSTEAPDFIGNGTPVRWATDGRRLVMDVATILDPGTAKETVTNAAIAVIDLDDATPTLRRITDVKTMSTYPDWHPSADLIVFMAQSTDPSHPDTTPINLFIIRPDGSELVQLTHFGVEDGVWGPTWAPDGSSILVTIPNPEWTLGRLAADGSDLEPIAGPVAGAHPRQQPTP